MFRINIVIICSQYHFLTLHLLHHLYAIYFKEFARANDMQIRTAFFIPMLHRLYILYIASSWQDKS